jgi:PAS domain S-box-containing protein
VGPLRVLIVDDNSEDRARATQELARDFSSVQMEHAADEASLSSLLRAPPFDVVITDYLSGWAHGLTALRAAKARDAQLPVLMHTAAGSEEIAVAAMKEGLDDYVVKDRQAGGRLATSVRRLLEPFAGPRKAPIPDPTRTLLQGVFEQIPVMISLLDEKGRLLTVNHEWEQTLGWKLEDARGVDLLAEMYPEPSYRQTVLAFIAAAERRWGEFKTRTRSGDVIDTAWANTRLADGTTIGIGQDISERKRLEHQLWQAQKLEAVGRLAGGIAHDFNNVLNVIMGYAELLARPLPPGGPERRKLGKIQDAAARAASLTRQLLAFSRQQVLKPRILDLGTVVVDVLGMLKRSIGEDVEVRSSLSARGRVLADPGQMELVLLNLGVNARDAMPTGGKLTIETSDVEIAESNTRVHPPALEGRYVMLAVSDNGQGMDPATQAQIFEPFFTTKGKGKGTGLGLSTVYGIVKQSDGHIWVDSEPGVGTTFKIYLPRVDAQPAAPAPAARADARPATQTILVVEDQEAGLAPGARRSHLEAPSPGGPGFGHPAHLPDPLG